jgi:hypothetical protein
MFCVTNFLHWAQRLDQSGALDPTSDTCGLTRDLQDLPQSSAQVERQMLLADQSNQLLILGVSEYATQREA